MTIGITEQGVRTNQESLNHRAKFDLKGHELIDPIYPDGVVEDVIEVCAPDYLPDNIRVAEVFVRDPYVEADPVGFKLVAEHIDRTIEPLCREVGVGAYTDRTEATTLEERNPATTAWLADDSLYPLSVWRENVPTALALDYLTNPCIGRDIEAPDGRHAVSTPETAAHWRFVADAIGIRARKEAMTQLTSDFLSSLDKQDVTWLSLASGTAEPSLKAGVSAMNQSDKKIDMVVTDHDGKALKLVKEKADTTGFSKRGGLQTLRCNILSDNIGGIVRNESGISEFDVVENMGFEEYLPQSGDTIQAFKGEGLPQASDFTRNAYELVAEGGMLVSGNMILPRPQLDFVFGAVDWPVINARTEEDIMRVYQEAGIVDDPRAEITMYRVIEKGSGYHIYNIVTVTKNQG